MNWDAYFPRLDRVGADSLELPFSKEEVKRDLMEAYGGKALGSDGSLFSLPKNSSCNLSVR